MGSENVTDLIVNFIFKKINFYSIVKIIIINNMNLLIFKISLIFVLIYRKIIKFVAYKDSEIIIIVNLIKFFNKYLYKFLNLRRFNYVCISARNDIKKLNFKSKKRGAF